MFAGHGVADTNYRPARLPYASIIGPLNLELEPDRDPPRRVHLWVQAPGFHAGVSRQVTDMVPAPGSLTIRLDGDAEATLALSFGALAGDAMTGSGTGRAVAGTIETALRAAVDGGSFTADGAPVNDPVRRAELRATTVRWDRARARLVIASGRRGVVEGPEIAVQRPSRAEASGGQLASALGFGEGALRATGRVVRHQRPNPKAVLVDVRFDLWAGTQLDLANALDAWSSITPTRGQLLERPALLAADAVHGAQQVRLQPDGESPTRWTLLQFERGGGRFADRLSDRDIELVNGATIEAGGVRCTGTAAATHSFLEPPPLPYAWLPDPPGLEGYAVSVGLRLDPGGAAGDSVRVLTVAHGALLAVALDATLLQANGALRCELRATAQRADGSQFTAAAGTLAPADVEGGVEVHVVVDAARGVLSLFVDAEPIASSTSAGGRSPGGNDMAITIGNPSVSTSIGLTVAHVQLHGRPIGPLDPRLRIATAPASAWLPGDTLNLAASEDGVTPTGEPFTATVVSVDGDELTLDRTVQGTFRRGASLVYKRALFFSQRQLRRQDDLMNQLYRVCIEYRVSTFLDERFPGVSAPLVEIPEVEVRDLARLTAEVADPDNPVYPVRPASGHPGTRAVVLSSVNNGPS